MASSTSHSEIYGCDRELITCTLNPSAPEPGSGGMWFVPARMDKQLGAHGTRGSASSFRITGHTSRMYGHNMISY